MRNMSYIPSSRVSVFSISSFVLGIRSKYTITATHKQTFIQTRFVTPNSCPYRKNFVCFLPSNFQPQSSLPLAHDGRSNITSFIVALVTESTTFISENDPWNLCRRPIPRWNYIILFAPARMDGDFVYWYSYLSRFCWIQILGSREMGIYLPVEDSVLK